MNKNIIIAVVAVLFIAAVGYYALTERNTTTGVINQMPVNSGENAAPGSVVHDLPVEPAAALARTDLAGKLGVDEKSIVILLIEEKEWSDGCLGLGGPAESCLMALVPGFRVEMQAGEKIYVYRTDKTGGSLRADPDASATSER